MKVFVVLIELLFIASGPSLIATDISLLAEWHRILGGDFYTIMTFAALISIWSIFGLTVTLCKSYHGLKIYVNVLSLMVILQFIISFIHSVLLFKYRSLLLDFCLQKQPNTIFWWSLGGAQNNTMMKEINDTCTAQWHHFVKQRIIALCIYNAILLFCLHVAMSFYHLQQKCQAQMIEAMKEEERHLDPDLDGSFVAEMYRQRQKIYDEIAKRRELRKSLHGRTVINDPPARTSLDLDKQAPSHHPPSPPIYSDSKTPLLDSKDEQELRLSPPYNQVDSQESFTTAETSDSKDDDNDKNKNQSSL